MHESDLNIAFNMPRRTYEDREENAIRIVVSRPWVNKQNQIGYKIHCNTFIQTQLLVTSLSSFLKGGNITQFTDIQTLSLYLAFKTFIYKIWFV